MRVAVVGAGIVGVTCAYELAADGHEVEVFERQATVAAGTSFANAGVLAPGYVTPWAAPGMPTKVLRYLFARHAPVRLAGLGWLGELPWLWRWWRACRPSVYQRGRGTLQALAQLSRERQLDLTRALALDYERSDGYLVLLRGARDLRQAAAGLKLLDEMGVAYRLLEPDQARAVEPGLSPGTPLRAAIHLAQDGVGNCRQFAHALKAQSQRAGVRFRFEQRVRRIVAGPRPVVELEPQGDFADTQLDPPAPFDAVVLCTGHESGSILAPFGVRVPITPVYGYSITAPVRLREAEPDAGPRSGLMDERYKVAITRLGQRVRVAGSAEIGGRPDVHHPGAIATLYKVLEDWFPGAAVITQVQRWKGARPMLADGPPIVGPSGVAGVWLNIGHGSSGWALACGSARVLADQLAGRPAAVDVSGLQLARLR